MESVVRLCCSREIAPGLPLASFREGARAVARCEQTVVILKFVKVSTWLRISYLLATVQP